MAEKVNQDPPKPTGVENAINMDVLEKIMQSEASIVCSPELISVCEEYYTAIDTLTKICHTDPHFSHVIGGTGLTNPPLLLHLRDTETSKVLHLAQPQPIQRVLHVHRHSVVLQNSQTQWKKKYPLLYYTSGLETSRIDRVKLFLSSRTHECMMRGSFGIPFSDQSTNVLQDEHDNVKFFLSSQKFQANFAEQTPNFLCSYRSVLGVLDRNRVRDPDFKLDSLPDSEVSVLSDPSEMYALKSLPALFHPEWPTQAFGFLSRQRPSGWPCRSTIQKVESQGCHLVPATNCSDENHTSEWQINFDAAERELVQTLSAVDKQAAFMFRCLVCDRQSIHRGVITMEHIKTIVLWTLEDHPSTEKDTHPLLTRFMQICHKFMAILSSGVCRHYFIPERNLFEDVPMQVLENIRDIVDGLLDQPWTFVLHCHLLPYSFYDQQNRLEEIFYSKKEATKDESGRLGKVKEFSVWSEAIGRILLSQIKDSFTNAFHDVVRLYVLTSCARLNDFTINDCIILHRDILRMVQDESVQSELYKPYVDVVCNNLASLYHVKALTVTGKREKEYFFIKAEAMMRESKQMDLCLGRTRLANLLFSLQRYPESAKELEELLAILDEQMATEFGDAAATPDPSDDDDGRNGNKTTMSPSEEFAQNLWEKWLDRKYTFDIMYNRTLRPVCPGVMKRSLSLTMCSPLGIQRHSVAVFSPNFHSRFLLALCHSGVRYNDKALPILLGLEAVLADPEMVKTLETSPYSEVNEKRIAGYYIVLGNCYEALHETEKAKVAFRKAMKVFPTPRNPANLLYMAVKYGDTIDGVTQGAKVLIVASAVSVALSYISSQI